MSAQKASGKKLRDEIEKKTGKSPEELYREREKRFRDAIELKEPDRVPVAFTMNYFPVAHLGGGLTVADAYYKPAVWKEASKKTIIDFEPDIFQGGMGSSGAALSLLQPEFYKWAGDGLGPNAMHQFIECEPLRPEEYELYLSDPSDYTFRFYLPRVWKALAPLAKLPPLHSLMGTTALGMRATAFSSPDVIKAFEAIFKAGQEQEKYIKASAGLNEELEALGFVPLSHGMAQAPFDQVSDYLRGMAGTMLDMFRHPDELLRTCEMLYTRSLAMGKLTLQSKRGNPKRVGSALHRGSDGFMSLKQFETFYWATFKRLVLELVDLGLVFIPFYEGNWEQRLEYLLDFPKGKTVARFALTDLKRAKEVLKGHTCIMGGMPHTMMQTSTPQEIEDYCKELFRTVGKGGGFILTTSTGLTQEARPENVRAMMNAALKYGRY